MSFLELAAERYSVRSFSERMVLKSNEAIAKINQLCHCIYGAPVVFLVCSDESRTEQGYSCTHMITGNRLGMGKAV